MVQILNRQPSFGELLGTGLSSGTQTGLQNVLQLLAQQKVGELQRRQSIPFWEQATGNPQLASFIANTPEYAQKELLQRLNLNRLGQIGQPVPQNGLQALQQPQQPLTQQELMQQAEMQAEGKLPQVSGQQIPQQPMVQQGEPIFGLSPKQEQLELKRREVASMEQKAINRQNEPYLKDFSARLPIAEEASELVDDISRLLDTGKVSTGFSGAIAQKAGTPWQNKETQDFISAVNKLVILEAQRGKGLPSKFRLLLEQAAKPTLSQETSVQKNIVNRLKKQADKIKLENDIVQDLIRQNDGKEPADLRNKVRLEMAKRQKGSSELDLSGIDTSKLKVGDPAYDEDTGIQYYWNGKKFVKG